MKLYFRDICLGEIIEDGDDFPWKIGTLIPNAKTEEFREFFNYLVDEDKTDDPPFSEELLDDANWSIIDNSEKRLGIMVPAVHPDNSIWWTWSLGSPDQD